MTVDNPKPAELYTNLISDGYTSKNLGSIDEFSNALSDPSKANQIYSSLISDGYTEKNLGSQKEFMQTFVNGAPVTHAGFSAKVNQSIPEPQKPLPFNLEQAQSQTVKQETPSIDNNFGINSNQIALNQQAKSDNTTNVAPQQTMEKVDFDVNHAAREQRNQQIRQDAIKNTVQKSLALKGITAQPGSAIYNEQQANYVKQIGNGDATVARDKNGVPGLQRTTGFWENMKNGWNEAMMSNAESQRFANMTAEERVQYFDENQNNIKKPDEYVGERPDLKGSIGHLISSSGPYLAKAATGAAIGAAAVAASPETGGTSLAGLPTAMAFLMSTPDLINSGIKDKVLSDYQLLKKQHPERSDIENMTEASKYGDLIGGVGGIIQGAAFTGMGLDNPLTPESKEIVGSTLKAILKPAAEISGISGATTAAQQELGNLQGIHRSQKEILNNTLESVEQNATPALLLSGLFHAPNLAKSVFKGILLKEANPADIQQNLQLNEQAGNIPAGSTDKVMNDLTQYKQALNKVPIGLSDESKLSVAGLVQKKTQLVEEAKTKDDSFKPFYQSKIDAIDAQIKSTVVTGRPLEHEIDEATGKSYEQPTYDNVAQQQVKDLAGNIAKGNKIEDPQDLQIQANFPDQLETELRKLSDEEKAANIVKEEPKTVVQDNIKSYLDNVPNEGSPDNLGENSDVKRVGESSAGNPSILSAVININGKTYEGKNHAEAILKAKEDGQDISQVNRKADGMFKLSDGTIISRAEAKSRFGQDRAELLIPQDQAAKNADKEYQTEKKADSKGIPEMNSDELYDYSQEVKPETNEPTNNSVNNLEVLKQEGKEIEPHKEVKVNKNIAIKDVLPKYPDLKEMEAGMLHQLGKDGIVDAKTLEDKKGLKGTAYNKLYDKGYLELPDDFSRYENDNYVVSDKGKKFIDNVDARLETRKSVKAGTDLFPEDANIPEIKLNKAQIRVAKEKIPKKVADKAVEQGITSENIDDFKHLFNGFPYKREDFENVKEDLNERTTEPTTAGQQGIGNDETGKSGTEIQKDQTVQSASTENAEPGQTENTEATAAENPGDVQPEIGKVAFARANSYAAYKEIHPEESVEDYNKLRASKVDIPTKELKGLSKKYKEENSKSFDQRVDEIADMLIKKLSIQGAENITRQGVGIKEIVKPAAEIIKAAYHAGEDVKAAIEKAIDYIREHWDSRFGDFNSGTEKSVRDLLNSMGLNEEGLKAIELERDNKSIEKQVKKGMESGISPDEMSSLKNTLAKKYNRTPEEISALAHADEIDQVQDLIGEKTEDQIMNMLQRKGFAPHEAIDIIAEAKKNILPESERERIVANTSKEANSLIDAWIGEKNVTRKTAEVKGDNLHKEIEKTIPKMKLTESKFHFTKRRQIIDAALDFYNETRGMSESEIAAKMSKVDKGTHAKEWAIYEQSKNLNSEQKAVADKMQAWHKEIEQEALRGGVIKAAIENYTTHDWNISKSANNNGGKFSTSTSHSKERVLSTMMDGWAEGLHLRESGGVNKLVKLQQEISSVIQNKALIEEGIRTKSANGQPVFSIKKLDGYSKIENPAFKLFKGIPFDVYAPDKVAKGLNNILKRSALYDLPGIETLTKVNAGIKTTILATGLFHANTFMRVLYLTTPKLFELQNPVKVYKEGIKAAREMTPAVIDGLQHGLTLGNMYDGDEFYESRNKNPQINVKLNKLQNVIHKMSVPATVKERLSFEVARQHKWLFGQIMTGLKVNQYLKYREVLANKFPNVDPVELSKTAAKAINTQYGGNNLELARRNPTLQHALKLAVLAPDWLESAWKRYSGTLKGGTEGYLYRRMAANTFLRGAALVTLSNMALALMSDEKKYGEPDDWEGRFTSRLTQAWKNGNLDITEIDITPLYHSLGGIKDHAYFSLFGVTTEPAKVLMGIPGSLKTFSGDATSKEAINYNRSGEGNALTYGSNKFSPAMRFIKEAFTSQNWQGMEFTSLPELGGYDDKGQYAKTQTAHKKGDISPTTGKAYVRDAKGYVAGTEKGGKKKGDLVSWSSGGAHPLHINQVPSFVSNQVIANMPTQIQYSFQLQQGQSDWFTMIANSIGFGIRVGKNK
jgi:hypothetical protein